MKILTPKFWLKGAGFLENNFKNLKALLKNILHVKGSEVILDFKGTLKKIVFKTFSVPNPNPIENRSFSTFRQEIELSQSLKL